MISGCGNERDVTAEDGEDGWRRSGQRNAGSWVVHRSHQPGDEGLTAAAVVHCCCVCPLFTADIWIAIVSFMTIWFNWPPEDSTWKHAVWSGSDLKFIVIRLEIAVRCRITMQGMTEYQNCSVSPVLYGARCWINSYVVHSEHACCGQLNSRCNFSHDSAVIGCF